MKTGQPATKAGEEAIKRLQYHQSDHCVAVGLSGGVDSSLTAALLVEAGWKVEGITLWLMSGKGACCSDGLIDAASLCEQLGITHHVVDSRKQFQKEIVEELLKGYKKGITPLPCSRCNRTVKFGPMLNWAEKERQIKYLATGHYARTQDPIESEKKLSLPGDMRGRYKLLRGLDLNKDQSYFLYDLTQEVLGKVVFPLGELTKSETRKEALRYGLRTANKPESQDLCLVDHHGSMKAFLDNYLPPKEGEIVLKDGTVIGKHDGIEHFTIGQRKGLGISWQEPLHVVKIEADLNRIVVAPRQESGQSSCIVGAVNWISISPPDQSIIVEVQIRYKSQPINARLTPIKPIKNDFERNRPYRCHLEFYEQVFSVTPGQAAVFYEGDYVLGGGIIENNQSN